MSGMLGESQKMLGSMEKLNIKIIAFQNPDLHFTMKIENDFDPKKFDGLSEAIIQFRLGVKLTIKEIEKIEKAKEAYRIRCKDGC